MLGGDNMSKVLVAYFSASGVTENVALKVARAVDGDLFEIEPRIRYTAQDLDWRDKTSRSTIEMQDKKSRPEITHTADLSEYDTVVIGFPVWWYTAPTIINTFLESTDFSGKTLIPFCTSGSTGISGCEKDLKNAYPQYTWKPGKRLTGGESVDDYIEWILR